MAKASAGKPTPVERKLVGVADTVIAAAERGPRRRKARPISNSTSFAPKR